MNTIAVCTERFLLTDDYEYNADDERITYCDTGK